ncbi:palmitoyltransferase ZDHHC21 [Takifugu rubripes]|uniref:palmitoyltransferase ZDHHC21 n=1 Tax=Takifugu rubripes TaxID=31033 RepID=UPI00114594CB|nr:palmitoyltransferase ZDHHC21 [Takifugu rubripes]XP_029695914.1 palmitoyltransferase ZDHHC21 [Takifugu rubripes]XP_029695915.1 palmitoyltransferase ZDHHC21 [Takifugu rubripes]
MKLRLHFVVDPMGWLCVSLVLGVWFYNTVFVPQLVLFPHYSEGHIPWTVVVCYYAASALCLTALLRASTADPGRLPAEPHIPQSERQHWELCNKCNLMRPKRSHHCSRCGHCVRRMDHHCPWINNCVGEDNHWLFLQLCFYTQLLSLFTLLLDFCQYYYFLPLTRLDQERFTTRHELALLRLSALMALLMFGGMSGLFYTQLTGILSDTTTIEKMAHFSNEMFTSKRSWQFALAEVCGTRWKLLWFLPLRSRQPLQGGRYSRAHV